MTDRPTLRRQRIERRRTLPGGRAVVGALLVAAAAVSVFGAHLRATAEPGTRYLVAAGDIEVGTRIDPDNLDRLFGQAPIELPPVLAERSVRLEDREWLVGQVVVAPLVHGDLLTRSAVVVDDGADAGFAISFPIPAAAAVAGSLRRGEHVDILATYGSGESAATTYVAVGVPLLAVEGAGDTSFGANDTRTLTVRLADREQVQALAHAVAGADVVVTRSPMDAAQAGPPAPYRPSLSAPAAPASTAGTSDDQGSDAGGDD